MKARLRIVRSSDPSSADRPVVVFLPGGPCFSSYVLRSMDLLSRSLDLAYVDPPGTGGQPKVVDPTFDGIVNAIESEVRGIQRPLVLCGHSFGGLYAVELAFRRRLNAQALVLLAVPLSKSTYQAAVEQYTMHMTPQLREAEAEYEQSPTEQTLRHWLSSYGTLYFKPEDQVRGQELLRADQISYETFRELLGVISRPDSSLDFIAKAKAVSLPKYLVAGAQDILITAASLLEDATASGSGFEIVPDSAHFMSFDQPGAVADLIERVVSDSKRSK
jgi:pimeloyl-ACP methyl ester carboxylesterase